MSRETSSISVNCIKCPSGPVVEMVLAGACPHLIVDQQTSGYLERVVSQLVTSTAQESCGKIARPAWWPTNVAFYHPIQLVRGFVTDTTMWFTFLKMLINDCAQFHQKNSLLLGPLRISADLNPPQRRVLATKQDCNLPRPPPLPSTPRNVIKKHQANDGDWRPHKRLKMEERMRPGSPRLSTRISLADKKLSSRAIVRLFDVNKEIPTIKEVTPSITQSDFMNGLALQSPNHSVPKQVSPVRVQHPIRLWSSHNIPFSSDYGLKLIERENYVIPTDVHLRKMEKLGWYMTGGISSSIPLKNFECTYEPKTGYCRTYQFPKRQFRQHHQTTKLAFLKTIIKQPYVRIELVDLDAMLARIKENKCTSSRALDSDNLDAHKSVETARMTRAYVRLTKLLPTS